MATKTANTWQEELAEECQKRGSRAPVYSITSDRRAGRTAWSCIVAVDGQNIAARYWYDGQYVNNAKEDAAEVACTKLRGPGGGFSQPRAGYRPSVASANAVDTSS